MLFNNKDRCQFEAQINRLFSEHILSGKQYKDIVDIFHGIIIDTSSQFHAQMKTADVVCRS